MQTGLKCQIDRIIDALKLNRLEGKSTKEIVEILNIPERTVEYHISQSPRFMREHLKEFLTWSMVFFLK